MRRILTYPAALLAALIVLFEELVWDRITDLAAWLARMRLVARLEQWVVTLGPYATLALFALPILTLLPVKLAALYLIAHGRTGAGIALIVVAKLIGTTISARLFVLAKPKLMTFALFGVVYNRVVQFKHWAHEVISRWPVVATMRHMVATIRDWGRRLRLFARTLWAEKWTERWRR
ncbi:MAG: hypothetical protein HQL58_00910 [Magnetococcales bacterium]|nr:hypothetical protein [Magnetococcales bacterium]